MTPAEFLTALIIAAAFFYWLDAMGTKEIARRVGRRACEDADVQFLDDTVVLTKVRLRWDGRGRLTIYREYKFEFTSDGSCRYGGEITVLGKQIERLAMEPYRIP